MGRSAIVRQWDRILNRAHLARRDLIDVISDRGLVSFSFDDFPANALHAGAAILEDAGWRGTYYACGGLLGTTRSTDRIATFDELQECLERGHELANHTFTHCNCTEISGRKIKAEIAKNDMALKSATRNFAFPMGASTVREQRLVRDLVTTGRGVENGINGQGTDKLNLRANPIYSSNGIDQSYRHIELTLENRGWLIFYTHDVSDNPSPFGCTPAELKAIVATVYNSGMEVLTVEEARLKFRLGPA